MLTEKLKLHLDKIHKLRVGKTLHKMREARLKNQPMHKKEIAEKRSRTLKANGTFRGANNNNWMGGNNSRIFTHTAVQLKAQGRLDFA